MAEGSPQALPDFAVAANQSGAPDVYEIENQALDRDGRVLAAMRALAPWADRVLLDLGCGSGYWLAGYCAEAAEVIGVEPDPTLVPLAHRRPGGARVLHGSAEHIPLADETVDVVHARFAYFFPPGRDRGLAEVLRVLRPGGTLVVVDNDLRHGQFAELLAANPAAAAQGGGDATDEWWAERGGVRHEVLSDWRFDSRDDLDAVLHLEFPAPVAARWLQQHPDDLKLTYGYVLFAVTKRPR